MGRSTGRRNKTTNEDGSGQVSGTSIGAEVIETTPELPHAAHIEQMPFAPGLAGPAGARAIASPVQKMHEQLAATFGYRSELHRQAEFARQMGSPFVGSVLEAAERQLYRAPKTAALIAQWPGDRAAAAVAMRLNAALHAIARRGDIPALSALYRGAHDDFDGAIAEALQLNDETIVAAMAHPTQTNEVGRAAALIAALMVLRHENGMPVDLIELGSSCGLNLNLARYAYDLGGVRAGDAASHVRIAPEWRGARLNCAPVEIASARGVDLNPQDAHNPATTERMLSFIWADQHARIERLSLALDIARRHGPRVDKGSAATWLTERLVAPQQAGVCRTVFHSMVLQYLAPEERRSVIETLREAGARADARRPLAWITFEWSPARSEVRLLLTTWPSGTTRLLATCHPYGAWIDWRAEDDRRVFALRDDLIAPPRLATWA